MSVHEVHLDQSLSHQVRDRSRTNGETSASRPSIPINGKDSLAALPAKLSVAELFQRYCIYAKQTWDTQLDGVVIADPVQAVLHHCPNCHAIVHGGARATLIEQLSAPIQTHYRMPSF